jgi:multiple sugar transport system permease protein
MRAATLGRPALPRGISRPWIVILPALVLVGLFSVYPFIFAVQLSLHRVLLSRPDRAPFVGLGNYLDVILVPEFQLAAAKTAMFTAITVPAVAALGLGVALLLNQRLRGFGILRWVVLLPWAVPLVAAGIIWRLLLHGSYGALNGLLLQIGLVDQYITWLSDPGLALYGVALAHVWREFPLAAILFLAGLQTIPSELHEAALADGAGAWARFRHISAPLLRPSLLVVLVYETVISIGIFDMIFVLTGGGPGSATTVISWYAYASTFKFSNLGQGAALSILMAIGMLILIVVYVRVLPSRDEG